MGTKGSINQGCFTLILILSVVAAISKLSLHYGGMVFVTLFVVALWTKIIRF